MNDDMTVRVPRQVQLYAQDRARREFLKPSEVVRSLMTRGMFADQLEESRRRGQSK
jgi:hypothetical protein